jgi:hypothetical protein
MRVQLLFPKPMLDSLCLLGAQLYRKGNEMLKLLFFAATDAFLVVFQNWAHQETSVLRVFESKSRFWLSWGHGGRDRNKLEKGLGVREYDSKDCTSEESVTAG